LFINVCLFFPQGPTGDQSINLLWIQIQGVHLRSQTLTLPLSPGSDLMWLGLSDARSPTVMDSDDVIRIYDKRSCQWRVLCDTNVEVLQIANKFFGSPRNLRFCFREKVEQIIIL